MEQHNSYNTGHGNSNRLELVIDNIQPGVTTGEYICLASNSEGSVEASANLVIAVPAYITQAPRNQTRLEGDRVEMICQARAMPNNITYKWFFNDRPIDKSRWSIAKRDGTLIIQSLTSDDQGNYKCQASNGILPTMPTITKSTNTNVMQHDMSGSAHLMAPVAIPVATWAEASAYLTVEYAARVTYSPPIQFLPLGLSGIVRCYVQSQPPFTAIHWTFNNLAFDPNVIEDVETLKNGSLLFKRVTQSNEGKYRCTPMNIHGSAGSSANMEVRVEGKLLLFALTHCLTNSRCLSVCRSKCLM